MDKLVLKVTFATVATVVSAIAAGGYYVGSVSRDVQANRQEIADMKHEWQESRKEMVALREQLARLNGLLEQRGLDHAQKH